jgi:nitrogen fixation/metabolism regulation signal transduction histidine kinase
MSKRTGAWALFLVFLLLLSLSATSYAQTANYLLISIRVVLLLILSVLLVREKFRKSDEPQRPDGGDKLLKSWRRWFYDEKKS